MTERKRIFVNFIATYGRNLTAVACGIFTSRWILSALGEQDLGLFGVLGGLVFFLSFLNTVMATAVGRYYAYAVGRCRSDEANGLLECRKWFSVALFIHTVLPVLLLTVGYPIGIWAIHNWLQIPSDRVVQCVWVFRFACVSCFVSMIAVPYQAMYTAKQRIAELTVYSFITTLLMTFFSYYMATHPGEWLVRYSFWVCVTSVIPTLIIALRAVVMYPECRVVWASLVDVSRIRELGSFAGWSLFGAAGNLLKWHGVAILVNRRLGAASNAAVTISNGFSSHATMLATSLVTVMMPAITNAAGANDDDKLRALVFASCKFGTAFGLLFVVPILVEVETVMQLWLVHPPVCTGAICQLILIVMLLEEMTTGHWVAISARGVIARYQICIGIAFASTLPIVGIFLYLGVGVIAVGYGLLIAQFMVVCIRLFFARKLASISVARWLRTVFAPIVVVGAGAYITSRAISALMSPSLIRIVLSSIAALFVMLPCLWWFLLDASERKYLTSRLASIVMRKQVGLNR